MGGQKHDRPLVLMAHQDVVPEEDPKGWKYPPYSGAIEEGKIWGRGAVDCKCMVFGSMVAANELINEGFVPEQDIYFCYGDDEENSGGSAIAEAKYLSETLGVKPVLVIDEGGGMVSKEPFKNSLSKTRALSAFRKKALPTSNLSPEVKADTAVRRPKTRRSCALQNLFFTMKSTIFST